MNNTEHPALPHFRKYILFRWPNWKPNEMEVADWCATLQKYPENVIARAMFTYGEQNEHGYSPSRKKFIEIAGHLVKMWKAKNIKTTEHNPIFWLVRELDGIMKPIYGTVGKVYSSDATDRIAQALAKRWSDFYHTNWFVVQSQDPLLFRQYPDGKYPIPKALPKQEQPEQEQPVYADAKFFEQESDALAAEESLVKQKGLQDIDPELDERIPF
jgi:hypothetical protein